MTPSGHRRLILARHAKSSWNDPLLDDFDRPLNDRGRRAARELGDFLASRGLEPEEVLCSPALRTRQTWAGVEAAALETRPEVTFIDALYHAEPAMMLEILRAAHAPTVMMIGHNPGLAALAEQLPAKPIYTPDFRKFPAGAALIVDFAVNDWAGVRPGAGETREFFTPSSR